MTDAPDTGKLASINRLESLSDPELIAVISAGRHIHLPADWALISESTPADKAYLIVDGEVSVRKGGTEIARLGPGDVIGEIAVVEHKLRTASVVSLTPLEVIHFTREALEQLLVDVPAFGTAIRGTTAERLSNDQGGDSASS
ncbi:cyclic nucleotide-binding domain-containing protein [Nocardioides marmoriginsengisoli]|uniref:Cyclic nucleotide-binding domain-containing protein n=1 Tax=Nocardioides marmoriginsengisoli TaxID=661483 RepID=A0A3N0CQD8_9ACTN|nr:cyclic nucleotide-binding domain-containing protein [Nocardioides marmoriginsengisoli]RNL65113.1 cyclic nucleotide-binding domain-containing protein [Nocardioides marmoriginsengisoli]